MCVPDQTASTVYLMQRRQVGILLGYWLTLQWQAISPYHLFDDDGRLLSWAAIHPSILQFLKFIDDMWGPLLLEGHHTCCLDAKKKKVCVALISQEDTDIVLSEETSTVPFDLCVICRMGRFTYAR